MNMNKHSLTPNWIAPANIHAVTTLRTGGVSTGAYQSLNLATHVGDDLTSVMENRRRLKNGLNLPSEPVWLEQTHSNIVIDAGHTTTPQQADASYTDQTGVVCAVMTADCLPVLICSKDGKQIAAIHAGWKGLLAGIISNTVAVFSSRDLIVWLGPAIGANCFEVGVDVYQAFSEKYPPFSAAFQATGKRKFLADIYLLARIELATQGVHTVYGGDFCTFTQHEHFYSYRRDSQTGRMATLIWRS
jgi:polyphenol oxidase